MITAITLSDPARSLSYVLTPNDAVTVTDLEVTPTVRDFAEDVTFADGSWDTTAYLGPATVTIDLIVKSTIATVMDAISAMLLPWSRPYLIVSNDEWVSPRQVLLRFESSAHPYNNPMFRSLQLAWKAPNGVWEDTVSAIWQIGADVPDTTGLTFTATNGATATATNGYTFHASTSAGSAIVNASGNARPWWSAKLYGPAVGPKLTRDDTGQSIIFTDNLVLGPGDYVELNSRNISANLLSNPGASRLGFLDFSGSTWFPLDPGANRIRYHASSGTTPGSVCLLTIYPLWMP